MTDPIADLLTRLRNAYKAGLDQTLIPASRMKGSLLRILKDHLYIENFKETKDTNGHPAFQVMLRTELDHPIGLKRVSKPGQRIYVDKKHIRKVMNGLGISIISTSQGVMTNKQARKLGLGGELICEIW